jgi:hypothetical protein
MREGLEEHRAARVDGREVEVHRKVLREKKFLLK